jgi:uncharacterized SAM-binding protein YcdF (DUF218 family)
MRPNVSLRSSGRTLADSGRRSRNVRSLLAGVTLLGALWVLAAPFAARFLIVRSEPSRADAIVVLSGSPVYAERLRHAARLYHEGRARAIVLTDDGLAGRWSRQRQRNPRSIERGRDTLLASGLPADRVIMLSGRVYSTYDEAVTVQAYARAQRLRSLLIVTSPYHARRALWVFDRVLSADNVSVGVNPVPPGDQSPAPSVWWLGRRGWQSVAGEYPKFLYYLIAYR